MLRFVCKIITLEVPFISSKTQTMRSLQRTIDLLTWLLRLPPMAAYLQPPMTPYLSVIQCSVNLSECKAPQYCARFEFEDLKA